MTLLERIKADLNESIDNNDTLKTTLLSSLYNDAVKTPVDAEIINIINTYIASITELARIKIDKGEYVPKEAAEITILEGYLTEQMPPEDLEAIIIAIVACLEEKSPRMTGKVLLQLRNEFCWSFDNTLANELALKHLKHVS